jgi:hypothetical protein
MVSGSHYGQSTEKLCSCVTHWRLQDPIFGERKKIEMRAILFLKGKLKTLIRKRSDGLGSEEHFQPVEFKVPLANDSLSMDSTWPEFFGFSGRTTQVAYYRDVLSEYSSLFESPPEIFDLISDLAADAYEIGQRLDCKDKYDKWCIGEIVGIEPMRIRVHYLGWGDHYDDWIDKHDDNRIAPLFEQTRNLGPKHSTSQPPHVRFLLPLGFSREEAAEAVANCQEDFQNSINYAYWAAHKRRGVQMTRNKKKVTCRDGDEIYELGQRIDAQDLYKKWCVAEITALQDMEVRVHYLGWPDYYDDWIFRDSGRLAPVFTHTNVNQPKLASCTPPMSCLLLELGFSEEEAKEAVTNSEDDLQNALNYAFYSQHVRRQEDVKQMSEGEEYEEEKKSDLFEGEFFIGQRVDAKDQWDKWCVAQILAIQAKQVKVHYLGWGNKYDDLIPRGKGRLAPLFSRTKFKQPRLSSCTPPTARLLIHAGFSEHDANEAIQNSGGDLQNAFNYVHYAAYIRQ